MMICFGFLFSYRGFEFKSLMQILLFLAGAVREIEMDLRIPLYLSDTSPLTRRGIAAAGHYR